MRRRSRLQPKTLLARLTTRYRPAIPYDVRIALAGRSGGWCEMQLPGCLGHATDLTYRIFRGVGGRHDTDGPPVGRLSAMLHTCSVCRQWQLARPAESRELGLTLMEHQDPARELVVYRGTLSGLTDDGSVIDFEDVKA